MSDVVVNVRNRVGHITLNRPKAINALTHDMVGDVMAALADWGVDDRVALIVVDGAGDRGLCAGGDIRALYDAARAGDLSGPTAFFADEYRMNAAIAGCAKPYLAVMDGLVMGGGIGISAHGRYRVVTERSKLAMPETGIGFVIDVGGTWLLGRAPDNFGLHAALTSSQLGAADAILCGLADHYVPSAMIPALLADLDDCATERDVEACLAASALAPPVGLLEAARGWIAPCYALDSVEAIVAALQARPEPAAREAATAILTKSPLALKVALRAVREAPGLGSLEACLAREFRLAIHSMAQPDFVEGVRAAVVDKDRTPRWSPGRLADVTEARVQDYFDAPDPGGLRLS